MSCLKSILDETWQEKTMNKAIIPASLSLVPESLSLVVDIPWFPSDELRNNRLCWTCSTSVIEHWIHQTRDKTWYWIFVHVIRFFIEVLNNNRMIFTLWLHLAPIQIWHLRLKLIKLIIIFKKCGFFISTSMLQFTLQYQKYLAIFTSQ